VRIWDASVLDYMNNTIFPINVASSETLVMAIEKSAIVWENYKQSIKDRMNWDYIISNRKHMESGTIVTQQLQARIDNTPKTSYSDLVLCLEKTETIAYTDVNPTPLALQFEFFYNDIPVSHSLDFTLSHNSSPDELFTTVN
jgi:hypothetical protein